MTITPAGLLPFLSLLATGAAAAGAEDVAAKCRALEGAQYVGNYRYSTLPDAPTYLHAARVVAAADGLPEFCEVKGYIAPQILFALRLPTAAWNGKLLVGGCGEGYCGSVEIDTQANLAALKRGYAVTTNDSGHSSTTLDGKWAYGNPQAKLDFAYRAAHANTAVAKQIITDFYGSAARRSYFQGCSTGGRQGMIAAQRFPKDFDGIIAGAPAMLSPSSVFGALWSGVSNIDGDGKQILTPAAAEILHRAAMAACDATDGLKDGQLGDPRQCKFDPASVQCKAGQSAECLTEAQVSAARRIYAGPVDSGGMAIHVAGLPPGSERGWLGSVIATPGRQGSNVTAMIDWFRFMAHPVDAGPLWSLDDLDWDSDPNSAGGLGAVYSAGSPDLREFAARGGKLIHYHGWQDAVVTPMESVDYYETATRAMGGIAKTQSFYRMFMIPGMQHCAGGEGADAVDYLTYLEDWVENGKAPDQLRGSSGTQGAAVFTRPHFPYPDSARYQGSGSISDAASFRRVSGDKSFEKRPLR